MTANGTIEPIYLRLMPGPFGFVGGMWFIYLVLARFTLPRDRIGRAK